MSKEIFNPSVDELATVVEEGTRANKGNIERFIEPAEGTLRRALSKWHHIVFGRRGSGKSSLIYKASDELSIKGNPVALVDLEPFKGHQYPDIIISVLLATLTKFSKWTNNKIDQDKGKKLWYTLGIKKGYTKETKNLKELNNQITESIRELVDQLHLVDRAQLKKVLIDKVSQQMDTSSKMASQNPVAIAEIAITEAFGKSKNTELQ